MHLPQVGVQTLGQPKSCILCVKYFVFSILWAAHILALGSSSSLWYNIPQVIQGANAEIVMERGGKSAQKRPDSLFSWSHGSLEKKKKKVLFTWFHPVIMPKFLHYWYMYQNKEKVFETFVRVINGSVWVQSQNLCPATTASACLGNKKKENMYNTPNKVC